MTMVWGSRRWIALSWPGYPLASVMVILLPGVYSPDRSKFCECMLRGDTKRGY